MISVIDLKKKKTITIKDVFTVDDVSSHVDMTQSREHLPNF